MSCIAPGATLGFLGGGQLGRLSAMAARVMGYKVAVLDPDPQASAAAVADMVLTAEFNDVAAATKLAEACQVVTFEIEKIDAAVTDAVAQRTPLRPGCDVLAMVQDRARQKDWLTEHGFAVGPYARADSEAAIAASLQAWQAPGRLKTRFGGYDGRGQVRLLAVADAAQGFASVGRHACVLEREIDLAAELSVLVARAPSGQVQVYPAARNWHEAAILRWSTLPAELPPKVETEARQVAHALAEALQLEGILAVEFFLSTAGKLTVNELAPRPHNTYHAADVACATSQFEQHVRAMCNLPLGLTDVVKPTAMVNILGDVYSAGPPDFAAALACGPIKLYLYGKAPRPGRKMGHLLGSGETPALALTAVQEAARRLGVTSAA